MNTEIHFFFFIFNFLLLFSLLPHKRDLRLKGSILKVILLFSIYHFSLKDFLNSSPINNLKDVTNSEGFTYGFIKACKCSNVFNEDLFSACLNSSTGEKNQIAYCCYCFLMKQVLRPINSS